MYVTTLSCTCSQVRASNLQELVYKRGQAGVTKATVSIVFDNTDPKQSPVGYEQYDQLTITRQVGVFVILVCFWHIVHSAGIVDCVTFGSNSTAAAVPCTVALRWNHDARLGHYRREKQVPHQWPHCASQPSGELVPVCPAERQQPALPHHAGNLAFAGICCACHLTDKFFHFAQGRIAKVLNMKPMEILGMVEEAAGTRFFEGKKQSSLKTIEKKQSKVEEINQIIVGEITPTLENLRAEKAHYLKWQANNSGMLFYMLFYVLPYAHAANSNCLELTFGHAECERLERFCIAHDYTEEEGKLEKWAIEGKKINDKMESLQTQSEEFNATLKETADGIEQVFLLSAVYNSQN